MLDPILFDSLARVSESRGGIMAYILSIYSSTTLEVIYVKTAWNSRTGVLFKRVGRGGTNQKWPTLYANFYQLNNDL